MFPVLFEFILMMKIYTCCRQNPSSRINLEVDEVVLEVIFH